VCFLFLLSYERAWLPEAPPRMEQDKYPDTLLATSTFLRASNLSFCVTRAGAYKSLDFSLATGRLKMGEGEEVVLIAPKTPDPSAVCSLQQIIDSHVENYGVDETTAAALRPLLIPLCRLVHMEFVQSVHRVSEAVESLKARFEMEGYCQSIGAKFYVQPRDANGVELFVTKKFGTPGMLSGKSRTGSSRQNAMTTRISSASKNACLQYLTVTIASMHGQWCVLSSLTN
jgi:hypothetical protein